MCKAININLCAETLCRLYARYRCDEPLNFRAKRLLTKYFCMLGLNATIQKKVLLG